MICKNFISFYKTFFKENKNLKNIRLNTRRKTINEEMSETELLLNEEENENENKSSDLSNTIFNENIEVNENMEIEYEIKFPEFLIKYSHYSKYNEQHINSDFSSNININDEESQINCDGTTLINKFGNTNILNHINYIDLIIFDEKASFNNLYINNFDNHTDININININHTPDLNNSITPDYTPMFGHNHSCKTNKTDYQINGRKNIQLYKSLFEQERFEELENLFEINTKRNYISFRFNFSFERFSHNLGIGMGTIPIPIKNSNINMTKYFPFKNTVFFLNE